MRFKKKSLKNFQCKKIIIKYFHFNNIVKKKNESSDSNSTSNRISYRTLTENLKIFDYDVAIQARKTYNYAQEMHDIWLYAIIGYTVVLNIALVCYRNII